jgi:hypothetical protein
MFFMKYLISVFVFCVLIVGCSQSTEINHQKKYVTLSVDTIEQYKKTIDELTYNSKHLIDFEVNPNTARYRDNHYLILSDEKYNKIFNPVINTSQIIDVYIKVAKDGGFFLRAKTEGTLSTWKSLIKEEKDSINNKVLKIYFMENFHIDTTKKDNKLFQGNDSINVMELNGGNGISYNNVLLYEQKWWRDDINGYILIYMWVKLLGDYGGEIEDIRFIE